MRSFGLIFGGTTAGGRDGAGRLHGRPRARAARSLSRRRVADPLLAYAKLELLTGAAALLTLPLLRGLPWAYGSLVARPASPASPSRGDRDPRRLRAAAADDPARCDGAARRRVPVAGGPRRSSGFRTPLPAQHARRRRRGGARSLRARSGAGSARNARRRGGGQPVDRKRGAALGARHPGGRAAGARRRRTARLACGSAAAASSSPSRRAPRPSASRCCGRARTRS